MPECDQPSWHQNWVTVFTSVTEDELGRPVFIAWCMSSDLDPVPSSLVKECIDILATLITLMSTYHSLKDPCLHTSRLLMFPISWKRSHLTKTTWKINNQCPISVSSYSSCSNSLPLSVHSAISVATFKNCLKTHQHTFVFNCYLKETSQDTSHWLGLFLIDTSTSEGLLLLNCFIEVAVEHWFGCSVTEPSYAGDIGTV